MLELADTMIGMKLPVLLVAPKSLDYSFIEQDGDVMRETDLEDHRIRNTDDGGVRKDVCKFIATIMVTQLGSNDPP